MAGRSPDELIFTSPIGEPLRIGSWRRRVRDRAVAAAGLGRLTPHDLRHTAAPWAIASRATVKHVQRVLGHKDAAMTLNVYASLFADNLDAVSERLDAAVWADAAAYGTGSGVVDLVGRQRRDAG